MKLEKQVTNLELSKKLKELGVKQESLWYWVEFEHNSIYEDPGVEERTHLFSEKEVNYKSEGHRNLWENMERGKGVDAIYSAFTVVELGELLPKMYTQIVNGTDNQRWFPVFYPNAEKTWYAIWHKSGEGLTTGNPGDKSVLFSADTEADARAKMLIYLLENKLI